MRLQGHDDRGGIKLELVQSPLAYTCISLNGRERQERYFYSTRFATFQGCMNGVCPRPEHVLLSHSYVLVLLRRIYLPEWFAAQGRQAHSTRNASDTDAGEDSRDSPGYCEVQEQGKTSLTLARNVSTDRRDCCSLPGVWRTLQSEPKGAIGSNGISRSSLGSFWAQQPPQPDHGWLLLKVAWHIQAGRSDSQGRHLSQKSDL